MGWRARCPVHGGTGYNLGIKDAPDGGIILNCFSHGCSYADIMQAAGVDSRPLVASVARPPRRGYEAPAFDVAAWYGATRAAWRADKLNAWADQLGVSIHSIAHMGATTFGDMLCFPMHDGTGAMCGIRTRTPSGDKRAIAGSKAGVFLPTLHLDFDPVICEGPTDAAAAIDLGFEPIGRPSCRGQEVHVVDTCKRFAYERVTICADADGPGIEGAKILAQALTASRIGVRLVTCGAHKDLRAWLRAGATRKVVEAAWSAGEWK